MVSLLLLSKWSALIDVVPVLAGLAWLIYSPGVGPVLFLSAIHVIELGLRVLELSTGDLNSELWLWNIVHLTLRLTSISLMAFGLRSFKRLHRGQCATGAGVFPAEVPVGADPTASTQRFQLESSYVSWAALAGYPRDQAAQEARTLTEAQMNTRIARFQLESSYVSWATSASYPRDQAIQQARTLSTAEMQARIERFQLESSYVSWTTSAGLIRDEAIAAARRATDAELRGATR